MTYEEAVEYMLQLNKRGIHPGLTGIEKLCKVLDNPEEGLRVIHVVGTNGKGSTSLFISNILRAAGYRVGRFSSPAVFNEREIITVNNKPITKDEYAALTEKIMAANDMGCTRFEVETVMAFMFFKKMSCDVVVLEAGMGGLTDATNVVKECEECVFTSIGLDHTDYLGNTIEAITDNKTGVIKRNCVVVTTAQKPEVTAIIAKKAEADDSDFFEAKANDISNVKYKLSGTTFDYKDLKKLSVSLLGSFQPVNAALAIEAVRALSTKGFNVKESHIRKALADTKIEGRFEKICDKPLIYIDGAHNEPASLEFVKSVTTYFTKKKIVYIMGMLKDKDCETVVKNTANLADCIFTVKTPNKLRTLSAFELADIIRPYNPMVSSMDSIEEALELASMMADKDTVIIVFGSLSHLSLVKGAVRNMDFSKRDAHGVVR